MAHVGTLKTSSIKLKERERTAQVQQGEGQGHSMCDVTVFKKEGVAKKGGRKVL